jgi:hypothetical protein
MTPPMRETICSLSMSTDPLVEVSKGTIRAGLKASGPEYGQRAWREDGFGELTVTGEPPCRGKSNANLHNQKPHQLIESAVI